MSLTLKDRTTLHRVRFDLDGMSPNECRENTAHYMVLYLNKVRFYAGFNAMAAWVRQYRSGFTDIGQEKTRVAVPPENLAPMVGWFNHG